MKCCLCTTNPALFLWLSPCSDMTLHENLHFIKVHSHGVAYSFTLRHSPNSTALFSFSLSRTFLQMHVERFLGRGNSAFEFPAASSDAGKLRQMII